MVCGAGNRDRLVAWDKQQSWAAGVGQATELVLALHTARGKHCTEDAGAHLGTKAGWVWQGTKRKKICRQNVSQHKYVLINFG